jgi:membrane protein DedA with SNARE-associated domain
MDSIGKLLWYCVFLTPLFTVPWVWKHSDAKKIVKIIVGLVLACLFSFILFYLSIMIVFRNGMGS